MSLIARLSRWVFYRPDETVRPIIIDRRRIYILPSRTGLVYALVMMAMFAASINYLLSLGYALVFLLVGVGFIGMIHTWHNLVGLRFSPGHAMPVFAGETALFPMRIENADEKARRALRIRFGKEQQSVRCDLPGNSNAQINIPCRTHRRGWFSPGRISLSTAYPLGLFRAWGYLFPEMTCVVYPRPVASPLPSFHATDQIGEQQGESGNEDFSGLRQRQRSDSLRHVAWKAVARDTENRPLMVKVFAGGATQELWLDWFLTPERAGTEEKLSILAGWVLAAEAQQIRYGLILPGCRIDPAQGSAHRATCLESLALYALADD